MIRALALFGLVASPAMAEPPVTALEAWAMLRPALFDIAAPPEAFLRRFSTRPGSQWDSVQLLTPDLPDPAALGLFQAMEAEGQRRLSCFRLGPEGLARLEAGQSLGSRVDSNADGRLSEEERNDGDRLFALLQRAGTIEAVVTYCSLSLPIRDPAEAIAALVDQGSGDCESVEVNDGLATQMTRCKPRAEGQLVELFATVTPQSEPPILLLQAMGLARPGS